MRSRRARAAQAAIPREHMSRTGWMFIAVMLLVFFEGALRKWVSPSLTLPLVALRDLLAVYTIWYTARHGLMPLKALATQVLTIWSCMVIAWGLWQTLWLQSSPLVLLIGLRFWLLYFWFAYAAAMAMNREDYRRSAQMVLLVLIASAPLVALQQASPPAAFINTQIDTEVADIFVVISGVVRPTGTFSFTLGYATLLSIALPVLVLWPGIAPARFGSRVLFLLAFAAFIAGTVLSGSRAAIIGGGLLLGLYLLGALWFSHGARKLYAVVAMAFTVMLGVLVMVALPQSIEAMQQRFESASEVEDIGARMLTIVAGEPEIYDRLNWLGQGLGAGSNMAAVFQAGERSFMLAESEPARVLLEGGLLGGLFTMFKIFLLVVWLFLAWQASRRSASSAPMVMWLALAIALPTWSTIGQLTVNPMTGLLLAFGILSLRFAPYQAFVARRTRPPLMRGAGALGGGSGSLAQP